ncbi:hypothetical protein L3X38_044639 [Prunus dulcis]|uniref:Uncharacterized protein n=1 Tax=Prunus dulcis TaxID=3755 RepID=A0AAD4V045_PRUDU|nr:hypothetical protein L3X38_044639 [Prunus dulcis]
MVSLRRNKRMRLCTESCSVLAPLPRVCDRGTAPQNSTQTKPDSVHSMPSNDVNLPEGNATHTRASSEIISVLREPAAAERVLLGLLGPDDTKIMQEYDDDGGLRQNLSHHALAACLHFAMWLREHGESSLASRERDEARARVAELEENVRNVEEILRHQVQEYEFKLNGLQNDVDQLSQKAELYERNWKEQEALHQEKDTLMVEVLRLREEAISELAKVTQSHDVARTRIKKLTGALTRSRKLYEQAEVEVKKVQQDCEMDRILGEIEKEERAKKEAKDVDGEVGAQLPSTFWTKCYRCNVHFQYSRVYVDRLLRCQQCQTNFVSKEVYILSPSALVESSSNSSHQQHVDTESQGTASGGKPPYLGVVSIKDPEGS